MLLLVVPQPDKSIMHLEPLTQVQHYILSIYSCNIIISVALIPKDFSTELLNLLLSAHHNLHLLFLLFRASKQLILKYIFMVGESDTVSSLATWTKVIAWLEIVSYSLFLPFPYSYYCQ